MTRSATYRKDTPWAVITLCGSTRHHPHIVDADRELTLAGHVVLTTPAYQQLDDAGKQAIDDVHRRKIRMSDEVVVVAPGGYVGESTRSEIQYAEGLGKPVSYLHPAVTA